MTKLDWITILNISLALAHQTDAAYWHEWDMFRLPGGIQLFTLINLIIFATLLACLASVLRRRASGFASSLLIAAASGSILPIHAAFALAGYSQFHLPVSVLLIVATFVASAAQALLTFRAHREFVGGA